MNAGRIRQPTLRNGRICPMRGRAVAVLALVIAVSLLPGVRFGAERNGEGDTGSTAFAGLHTIVQAQTDWGQMPLYFIANQGQLDARVAYYVQGRDKTLYFTPDGVTFALTSAQPPSPVRRGDGGEVSGRWIVKLDFVGANPVRPVGQAQTGAVVSYFKGPRDEWHTGLPTYAQIVYPDLWEGIDLTYSGTVNRLKYEFVVRPGADPTRIRLAYRGASVRLNEAGQLEVSTPAGGFQDDAPAAYQEVHGQRVPVPVAFTMLPSPDGRGDGGEVGFRLGAYDPTLPLVIDPVVLVYCGFIGGSGYDEARAIAVDRAGNAYVSGETRSVDFPAVVGPDPDFNGDRDAFVVKVKADGTGLAYAGYVGGNDYEYAEDIAVDTAGRAYITGVTFSNDGSFPVTVGPDLTHNGDADAFVVKVSADGTALIYAGFIGGADHDSGEGIAVDSAGNAYISGQTSSPETSFPDGDGFGTLPGLDQTYSGVGDAFVAKVRADGTGLVYATYIGGNGSEGAFGIAVDSFGNAYVVGEAYGGTFPVTVGPDLTYNGGYCDGFVAKVNASGTALIYAGFIGGSSEDYSTAIAVDAQGYAYIAGYTESSESTFPVTVGPDLTYNGGTYAGDAFVARVKPDGSGLVYAGYIGGTDNDWGWGVAVDAAGCAYVTGSTESDETTFPVTVGPDLTHNGVSDAFVAKVRADGSGLIYAGYIGGDDSDAGEDIAVDAAGNAYIAGATESAADTFPVKTGPDLSPNGDRDAFVAKVYHGPAAEHPIPTANSDPYGITTDAQDNIWFTESAGNQIGRLTPAAGAAALSVRSTLAVTLTEYAIPTAHSTPSDIVLGPDGNLWFTEYGGDKIGRITPAGAITEYPLPQAGSAAIAIAVGPDGNLWFCEEGGNRIGKMNTSGTLLAEYNVPTANSGLNDIVAGPDGALWFTEYEGQKIGRITTDGTITEYPVGAKVFGLALGPDGNLWFTETMADRVGRITPAGVVTEFDLPGDANGPQGITAGPFNSLWVVANFSNKVLRVLPSGTVLSEYTVPTSASGAVMIATDSSGALWFTEMDANQIGQLTPSGGTLYLPLVLRSR